MPYAKVSLSTMQKRARQKTYRLRKGGASSSAIESVSPLRPWSEVQAMTPGQKRSYRAALARFTSRSNRLYVYQSGDVAPYSQVVKQRTQISKDAARINRGLVQQRKRINDIRVNSGVSGAGNIKTIEQRQRERGLEERDASGRKTGRVHEYLGNVYGVSEVKVDEPPVSEASARRRAEALREMARRNWSERRESLRKNAVEMAEFSGDVELAEDIEALSDDQFDVLTQRTNFMDELSVMYSPHAGAKGKKEFEVSVSTDDQGAISTQARSLLEVVSKAVK